MTDQHPNSRPLLFCEVELDEGIEKGTKAAQMVAQGQGPIRGIATSERFDLDNDRIYQDGIDWSFCKSHGVLTLEHPVGVANSIGEPTKIEPCTTKSGAPGALIEGFLWLGDALGRTVFRKALAMQKSGSSRRIGLSIEGDPIEVKPNDKGGKDIVRSVVRSIAVSMMPRNLDSHLEPFMRATAQAWADEVAALAGFAKAEAVGYPTQGVPAVGSVGTLAVQSLQGVGGKVDGRLLSGVSNTDLLVQRVLRQMPQLTWAQGVAVVEAIMRKFATGGPT